MLQHDIKRLSRLSAIVTRLQAGRVVTATELAEQFAVSVRTIYRDIRALEQAGVPVVTEDGKGYSLMDHYHLPPIAFTEAEANALIAVEQLVLKTKDGSLVADYAKALTKITAVLKQEQKERALLLTKRTQPDGLHSAERTSHHLSAIQSAITHFQVVRMSYVNEQGIASERSVEPFALLSTENWLLVAWCRSRAAFRYFRLDRITVFTVLDERFTPHPLTLQEFFEQQHP